MGLDFKAPNKNDDEAWEIISQLYNNGFAFRGCGCFVGYEPPTKLRDLPNWLTEHTIKHGGEKILEAINAKK